MLGILFFALIGIWIAIDLFITGQLADRFFSRGRNSIAAIILFLFVLPLPIVDEIIGKIQFDSLCQKSAEIHFDPKSAAGRTVYFQQNDEQLVTNTWLPIKKQPWRFIDANNSEIVVSYNTFSAGGGFLARHIVLTQSMVPFTFKGYCSPAEVSNLQKRFEQLQMHEIRRPTTSN